MTESTITRSEICDSLARSVGVPKQKANDILDAALNEMIVCLAKDGELKLSSFGSFLTRSKKDRVGRNPKTGIEVTITPRKTVSFRASHTLKEKVSNGNSNISKFRATSRA